MHLKFWIYLAAAAALAVFVFHKFKAFGGRRDQVERRHPGPELTDDLEERRKEDDVGGED